MDVGVEVTNAAAPRVRIVTPADGARLAAGVDVPVRVESEGAERLWLAINGTRLWSVRTPMIQGSWAPDVGRYRIVAVAERDGAPDALAVAEVVGVADASPATAPEPPAGPVAPGGTGPAPYAGAGPRPPATPAPGRPAAGAPIGTARARGHGTWRPGPPSAPAAVPAARARRNGGGDGGWTAPILAFLGDPEKVAWSVALPLLLAIATGAYLLLQRFIDGGQKLAWRGRGRPDDAVVEF